MGRNVVQVLPQACPHVAGMVGQMCRNTQQFREVRFRIVYINYIHTISLVD